MNVASPSSVVYCSIKAVVDELNSLTTYPSCTVGSHADTRARNRKYMYTISSRLEKAAQTVPKPVEIKELKQNKEKKKKKKKDTSHNAPEEQDVTAEQQHQEQPKEENEENNEENDKKKNKKKRKKTPVADDVSPPDSTPCLRKSVRINLKKNLVRRIGEPPFPENVRTPPTSKPKGSALKQGGKSLQNPARKQSLNFDLHSSKRKRQS